MKIKDGFPRMENRGHLLGSKLSNPLLSGRDLLKEVVMDITGIPKKLRRIERNISHAVLITAFLLLESVYLCPQRDLNLYVKLTFFF